MQTNDLQIQYNHLTACKQMNSGSFKNVIYKLCAFKLLVKRDVGIK